MGEDEVDEEKELKKKQADKFRELLRDKVFIFKSFKKYSNFIFN